MLRKLYHIYYALVIKNIVNEQMNYYDNNKLLKPSPIHSKTHPQYYTTLQMPDVR